MDQIYQQMNTAPFYIACSIAAIVIAWAIIAEIKNGRRNETIRLLRGRTADFEELVDARNLELHHARKEVIAARDAEALERKFRFELAFVLRKVYPVASIYLADAKRFDAWVQKLKRAPVPAKKKRRSS